MSLNLINPFTKFGSGGGGGGAFWTELGRASVSSGDVLDTGTIEARDNMMILCYTVGDGTVHPKLHFNNDTSGNDYSFAYSGNGATNTTSVDQNYIRTQGGISGSPRQFSVSYCSDVENYEKLLMSHLISAQSTGASNAPTREINYGKFASNDQVTRVDCDNGQVGSYDTDTELVVLGYDNDGSGAGDTVWEQLATVTGDGSAVMSTGTITAKKYLMYQFFAGGAQSAQIEFNDDTAANYTIRQSIDGAADQAYTSISGGLGVFIGASENNGSSVGYIVNNSGQEKLVINQTTQQNATGSSNAPVRKELVGKWANTSASITKIDFNDTETGGSFGSDSYLTVWGFS